MNRDQQFRFAAILLTVVLFSAGGAGAMSVVAGTQPVSDAQYPVCTAPCVCMSESDAGEQWGAEGYEMCSKTICGQTADAMIQFYCIHPKGAAVAREAVTTVAVETAATTTVQQPVSSATTALPVVVTTPVTTPAAIPTKSAPSGFLAALAVAGTVILVTVAAKRH